MSEITNNTTKRIDWIDGIKGISCLFIFFHHFCIQYFPSTYFGNEKPSMFHGIDTFLSTSPLGFFINGNFFVHLFIFISGYVITYQIISMKHEKIGLFMLKRYLKLLFPIAVFGLIMLFSRSFHILKQDPSIKLILKEIYKIVYSVFIGILFKGDNYLGGHFWMMNCIFLGGLLVGLITTLLWYYDDKRIILIPVLLGCLLFVFPLKETSHFPPVFFGCALCMINKYYSITIKRQYTIILLIISIILGAFPSSIVATNFYKYLLLPLDKANSFSKLYWHNLATILFIIAIANNDLLKSVFSTKICLLFSKISFWVYLIHVEIIYFADRFLKPLQDGFSSYLLAVLVIFLIDLIIILLSSTLLYKFISPIGTKGINLLFAKLQPKTEDN